MKHRESELQRACVRWFDLQYPKYKQSLFAIPNGGVRRKTEGAIMKAEGVRAGVADMFFAKAKYRDIPFGKQTIHHGLFIEFKTDSGKQSLQQQLFMVSVTVCGFQYEIVKTFERFKELIEEYAN